MDNMSNWPWPAIAFLILLGVSLVMKWRADRQMDRLMNQLNAYSRAAQRVILEKGEDEFHGMQLPGKKTDDR